MLIVLNQTHDQLRELDHPEGVFERAIRTVFPNYLPGDDLPDAFIDMSPGEGGLGEVRKHAEVGMFAGVIHNGKLYMGMEIVFHYRNDSTRHMWGTPVTLEPEMPSEESQTRSMIELLAVINSRRPADVMLDVLMHQHDQGDGRSTDDRHGIILFFPYPEYVGKNLLELVKQYAAH